MWERLQPRMFGLATVVCGTGVAPPPKWRGPILHPFLAAPILATSAFVLTTALALINTLTLIIKSSIRPVALVIETPISAITLVVQTAVNPITFVIQTPVHAIAFLIQTSRHTIPAGIGSSIRAIVQSVINAVAFIIESCVNSIAAIVQTIINSITPVVEPRINTISAPIQAVLDAITLICQYGIAEKHQSRDQQTGSCHAAKHSLFSCLYSVSFIFSVTVTVLTGKSCIG